MVQHKVGAVSLNGICCRVNLLTACSCQQEAQHDPPHTHTHILQESHTRPGLTCDLLWMSKPHENHGEGSETFEQRARASHQFRKHKMHRATIQSRTARRETIKCFWALRSSAIFNCKCQHVLPGIALTNAPFHRGFYVFVSAASPIFCLTNVFNPNVSLQN